jgi:hypothetical protein
LREGEQIMLGHGRSWPAAVCSSAKGSGRDVARDVDGEARSVGTGGLVRVRRRPPWQELWEWDHWSGRWRRGRHARGVAVVIWAGPGVVVDDDRCRGTTTTTTITKYVECYDNLVFKSSA